MSDNQDENGEEIKEDSKPVEKKVYKVLRPIALGGRVEAGSEVELDDETASSFADGFIQEVGTGPQPIQATPIKPEANVATGVTADGKEATPGNNTNVPQNPFREKTLNENNTDAAKANGDTETEEKTETTTTEEAVTTDADGNVVTAPVVETETASS